MARAIIRDSKIVKLTVDPTEGEEIGDIPSGVGLERLRWDSTSLIDLNVLSEIYVDKSTLELYADSGSNRSTVTMQYEDRNDLFYDTDIDEVRLKTAQEVQDEEDEIIFNANESDSKTIIKEQLSYTRKIDTDIIITDKSERDPDDLNVLYNGLNSDYITIDTTSDLTVTGVDYWIQYRFPVERIIKSVINYGTYNTDATSLNIVACYYGYSLNGVDWTYIGLDSTTSIVTEYSTYTEARSNYFTLTDELAAENDSIKFSLLRGRSAKYFRMFILAPEDDINQTNFTISELRFNEITKAQELEVESLSAFTADVGLLNAGVIQSNNFDDGGVQLDLDNDVLKVYDDNGILRVELGKLS